MKTFPITLFTLPIPYFLYSPINLLFYKKFNFTWLLLISSIYSFVDCKVTPAFTILLELPNFRISSSPFNHHSVWPTPASESVEHSLLLETLFPQLTILNLHPSSFLSCSHSLSPGGASVLFLAFSSHNTGSWVALVLSPSCVILERLFNLLIRFLIYKMMIQLVFPPYVRILQRNRTKKIYVNM